MKHSICLLVTLLHIVCNADSVSLSQSNLSRGPIALDNSVQYNYQNNNSTRTVVPNPITISTQHKSFCYHTAVPQYDLNHMSTDQLAWYFSSQGYTEGEILSHPMLYMNQAYLTLAKQLPRYPEYVKMYYEKYRTYKGFFKFWETIHFRYRKGMRKKFARLHWECEEYRKAQGARHSAAQQTNISTIESHEIVNANTIRFAREYGITEQQLTLTHNNAQAQQLHREFLDQLSEAQTISAYYALQPKNILIDAVGHSVAIGMEANRLQQPDTATIWATFGWKALEIIQGVGDGLLLCAENIVHCAQYPEHAATEFVYALGNITGYCARAIGTVACWHELMEQGNGILMAQEMDMVANKIAACGTLCAHKLSTMSTRDIAKNITHIAADIAITHKMLMLGSRFFSELKPIVFEIIKNIRKEEALVELALQGAEEFGSAGKISLFMEETEANSAKNISKNVVQLSESFAESVWTSKGGLIYGPDKKFGARINHILQHTTPNPSKLNHTVFTLTGDELFDLIDFAWSKRGIPLADDPGTYIIELEKIIGTQGEKAIKIVVIPETNQVITAYPIKV